MLVRNAVLSKINKFNKSLNLYVFLHNTKQFAVFTWLIIKQAPF
jgi:hypothetical protein